MGELVSSYSNLIQVSVRYDEKVIFLDFGRVNLVPVPVSVGGDGTEAKSGSRRRIAGLADWQKNKVARYIDDNIDGPIRIEDLGQQVRLSASRFSKGFKQSFGRSPYDYVLLRRMEAAKYLIATTQEPLSQVAQACGLSDQAHLSKVFKRFVGVTPLRWRRAEAGVLPSQAEIQRWRRLNGAAVEPA